MAKALVCKHHEGTPEEIIHVIIKCPGCGYSHAFTIKDPNPRQDKWTWNNSIDKPTFSPSMLVSRQGKYQCHSFVKEGKIRFLGDCFHELKNQTIELEDYDEDMIP